MDILFAVLIVLAMVICWALNFFNLPGNWLVLGLAALYRFLVGSGGPSFGWQVVIILLLLATVGEILEFAAGAMGASRLGGSRRGAVMALGGSILGAVLGTMIGLPIPVVGPVIATLLFASLGALAGAMLGEQQSGRSWRESWNIGQAAFWGRLFGTLGKVLVGSVMVVVVAVALIV